MFDVMISTRVCMLVCVFVCASVRAVTVGAATWNNLFDHQIHGGNQMEYTYFACFSFDFG